MTDQHDTAQENAGRTGDTIAGSEQRVEAVEGQPQTAAEYAASVTKPSEPDDSNLVVEQAPEAPEATAGQPEDAAAQADPQDNDPQAANPSEVNEAAQAVEEEALDDTAFEAEANAPAGEGISSAPLEGFALSDKQDSDWQHRPNNINWAIFQGLRDQQEMQYNQDLQQRGGIPFAGAGYLETKDGSPVKARFKDFEEKYFGGSYETESDKKRRRDLQIAMDEANAQKRAPLTQEDMMSYQTFEDKMFNGAKIHKNLMGGATLSRRINDAYASKTQEVFDNGKSVRIASNGGFNASSAMAMAMQFQGARSFAQNSDGSSKFHAVLDENGDPRLDDDGNQIKGEKVKRKSIDININLKRTLMDTNIDHKRNLLIIANLHTANDLGMIANIKGKNIGDLSHAEDLGNYLSQNLEGMKVALEEHNEMLRAQGEAPVTLNSLYAQQVELRNGGPAERGLDSDVELSEGTPSAVSPLAAMGADGSDGADGAAGEAAEAIDPEEAALAAQALENQNAVPLNYDPNEPESERPEEVSMDARDLSDADLEAMYGQDPDLATDKANDGPQELVEQSFTIEGENGEEIPVTVTNPNILVEQQGELSNGERYHVTNENPVIADNAAADQTPAIVAAAEPEIYSKESGVGDNAIQFDDQGNLSAAPDDAVIVGYNEPIVPDAPAAVARLDAPKAPVAVASLDDKGARPTDGNSGPVDPTVPQFEIQRERNLQSSAGVAAVLSGNKVDMPAAKGNDIALAKINRENKKNGVEAPQTPARKGIQGPGGHSV